MGKRYRWEELLIQASSQSGFFNVQQAQWAGVTHQALQHHLRSEAIDRVRRGVYRVPFLVVRPHDALTVAWLSLACDAVVSHATALALHDLGDMPDVHEMTTAYTRWRRRAVPKDVKLHFASLDWRDMTYVHHFPVTHVLRTLVDCHHSPMHPGQVDRLCVEAIRRGLVDARALRAALAAPHSLHPDAPVRTRRATRRSQARMPTALSPPASIAVWLRVAERRPSARHGRLAHRSRGPSVRLPSGRSTSSRFR